MTHLEEQPTGIAIVGLAGRFPGAKHIDAFWQNLRTGVESITFFDQPTQLPFGQDRSVLDAPNYVKAEPVLDDIDLFDASFFGFTPREAEVFDPQQRLFLECAWEALELAGYDPEAYDGAIGVFGGMFMSTYLLNNLLFNRKLLTSVGELAVRHGNDKDYLATRVSYKLNLKGPSVAVQSSCSTSLVAVHLACQSLLNGECDMALAGGASISVPQQSGYLYHEGSILSPDGHCRAFDAEAQGTIFGSGVGVVALKRLQDALEDGDYIHAVIRGSAINNDGSSKVGYTAPSVNGQRAVIAEALAVSEIEPETIGYVEAHGTGTPLGDPIEIAALTQAYRDFTDKTGFCAIGAVKTNIGHLGAAAGVAGLIKTTLALRHGQIPPSLHFNTPNPQIDFAASPFYVNTALADWPRNGGPRRAGLSSFGMGGTNVHAILEEAPLVVGQPTTQPAHLLVLSAKTSPALDAMTANLLAHLRAHPDLDLADVAATLQRSRSAFQQRRVLICSDVADAITALETLDPGRVFSGSPLPDTPPVVFMFPGQGAQYINMARELYEHAPIFRQEIDRCVQMLTPHLDLDLRTLLFTSPDQVEAATPQLQQTAIAQAALFVIEYALAQLWQSWGVRPQAMIGHSIGEYVAATLAGVLRLEDALMLVAARGRLMQETAAGTMLTVQLAEQELRSLLTRDGNRSLSLAAVNGPALCVVSGPTGAIEQFERQLQAQSIEHRRLHTSHAFHSTLMEPILEQFAALVRRVRLSPPELPYLSNVSGTWITAEQATDPAYWTQHLRGTVRFADGLRELLSTDGAILLEVGPGQTLSALARRQLQPGMTTQALASLRHPRDEQPDLAFALATLGKLWLAGVKPDWSALYADERRLRLPLPTYPFQRQRYWIDPPQQSQIVELAPATLAKHADLADWFYHPTWQRAPLVAGFKPEHHADSCWLIFADECGVAERLIERLAAYDQRYVVVQPGQQFARLDTGRYIVRPAVRDDYAALLADLHAAAQTPTHLLHLWGVTADHDSALASHDLAQQRGALSVIMLAEELHRRFADTPLQLQVVTNHTQQVADDEPISPAKSAVLGLCATLPLAYPQLTCRSIDIALPVPGSRAAAQLADHLLAEHTADHSDRVVALRKNSRWVKRVESLRLVSPEVAPLRDGGVYLIDGGLTATGLDVAESLARIAGVTLIVTTDTPDQSPELREHLSQLELLGAQVIVHNLDPRQSDQMHGTLDTIAAQFGPLHGVIHVTANLAPQTLDTIEPEAWTAQMDATLRRLDALRQALDRHQLDFRIVLLSGAELLGGADAGPQMAAAQIVAAYAQQSYALDAAPWRCVLWPDESHAIELAPTPVERAAALARILTLQPNAAVAQIIVSTADLQRRIEQTHMRVLSSATETPASSATGATLYLRPNLPTAYVAPRTPTEHALISIWQEAFGIGHIGIHDNFFDLGGHSLLATQLVARLRTALQVELPMRALFEASTVAELAQQIDAGRAPRDEQIAPIAPITRDGALVLSFAQQRLWFLDQLESGSATYNIPAVVRLCGLLDVTALGRSINTIVARHEALRTTFTVVAGQPTQVIAPSLSVALPLIDLQALTGAEQEREADRLIAAQIQQPFDLQRGPLLRAATLRLSAQEHIVVFVVHHIAADGWSMNVLVRELAALYETISQGQPVEMAALPPLPIQYADYAHWQRQYLRGAVLEQQLSYWKQHLLGEGGTLPVLDLPTDRPRPPLQTFRGAKQTVRLSQGLSEALKTLSQREGVTLFMTLLATWQTMLHRYSGDEQIIVGTPIANRSRSELEGLIGVFANTLVLRGDLAGDPTFRALLGRVREMALQAYAHQDVPFEQLVETLQLDRDLSRNPLFQVLFSLQQPADGTLPLSDLTFTLVEVDSQTARFDLTLSMIETDEGLIGTLEYNTDLFFDATATRMLEQLETLLTAIAADPDERISALPLLSQHARRQMLTAWNQTRRAYPQTQCVHHLFEQQAARTPDAVAAVYESQQLTYAELNRRANQLAHHLWTLGAGTHTPVAVFVDRSLEMLIALLGVLKAGAAYIPLDPIYPPDRIAHMLNDAAVPIVLTEQALAASLPTHDARLVRLDADWPAIAQQPATNPASASSADDLVYIIYTSGSTGLPKGVQIPHRAVVNFLTTMAEQPGLASDDVLLAVTTLSFDIAGLELFLPLSVGARVVIASRAATTDGAQLAHEIAAHGVTVMQATPATWRLLIDADWRDQGQVKVLCGGEAVPRDLANELLRRGVAEFWNVYGPTETTIWSSIYRVWPDGHGPVSIGRPIANTQLYVLDAQMQPVPIGVPGELYIGGDGLARGYLDRAALTAEKFVPDPFNAADDARLYRTGDLVRYRDDGTIEFLRRIDQQIKLRGYRIELGEIEAALVQHPAVQTAAVTVREDVPGDPRLVGYIVVEPRTENQEPGDRDEGTNEQRNKGAEAAQRSKSQNSGDGTDGSQFLVLGSSLSSSDLRAFLKPKLPEYMIPSVLVQLDALPLTPNGKLNRRALPAPDSLDAQARLDAQREVVAPRTPIEQQLVTIWSELLRAERVSIHDNFFALGGHSLLVTQLVFKLRDTFAIDLPLRTLFESPTVAELAEAIQTATRTGSFSESSEMTVDALQAEVALDPAITAGGLPAIKVHEPQQILLTGATGFLGAFLLRELIERTDATITCVVRAASAEEGLMRIRRNLAYYGIWQEQFSARIVPLNGDLGQPLLGLSSEQFQSLARRIDAIYHNGAFVNFIYPYAALKPANVLGTQEVLRLAAQERLKPVYFVSTHSTLPFYGQVQAVVEQHPAAQQAVNYTGYIQSKWVAEQIILLARARGLPVAIFRPGRISGASDTGACQTNDFLWRMIKACIQVGAAPDLDLRLDMTPVEHVARVILDLAHASDTPTEDFNLVNPEPIHLRRLVDWMRALGYPIELVSYDGWRDALMAAAHESTGNAAYELLPFLTSQNASEDEMAHQVTDLDQAKAELPPQLSAWPALDDRLLATYFGYFIQSGYLEAPALPDLDLLDEDEHIVFDI